MKDIDIRQELHKNHLVQFKYDNGTRIIDELGLCQGLCKIDIAVINGSLIGYEIKSEQDNLNRLPTQIEIYDKVFDFINIVVNEKHISQVKKIIPTYWGIMCVKKFSNDFFKLEVERTAEKNENSESYSIIQLLWKKECMDILISLGLEKGMKNKARSVIWKKITDHLPKAEINNIVRNYIKQRDQWRQVAQQQL